MAKIREATERFLLAGLGRGWAAGTHDRYARHLALFTAWCAERGVLVLDDLTPELLEAWAGLLRYQDWTALRVGERRRVVWAEATCKQGVTAVKSFLGWCVQARLLADRELAADLHAPPVHLGDVRTVTLAEVDAMLAACRVLPGHGVTPAVGRVVRQRDAALIVFLFDSLVRAAELCGLDLDDVDLVGRRANVLGKGGQRRDVPFGPTTETNLRAWLAVRPRGPEPALFTAVGQHAGARLTVESLRQIVERIGQRAGLRPVTPHAFRRGGACAAVMAGAPTRIVQIWGGWSDVAMVERYTRSLVLSEGVAGYSPVERLSGGLFVAPAGAPRDWPAGDK